MKLTITLFSLLLLSNITHAMSETKDSITKTIARDSVKNCRPQLNVFHALLQNRTENDIEVLRAWSDYMYCSNPYLKLIDTIYKD